MARLQEGHNNPRFVAYLSGEFGQFNLAISIHTFNAFAHTTSSIYTHSTKAPERCKHYNDIAKEAERWGRHPPLDSDTMVVFPDTRSTTPRCSHTLRYRMTSSAWNSRLGGIVSPRAWAALKLMISSNLVGCSTGRSAGLAPLRILST